MSCGAIMEYFIVFIDDKSSHMWTANLRKKSDVAKAIKNFETMARIQHGATIKRWWIDQGREFINSDLIDTLKGLGIVIEQSIPHQRQQNGRAERAIRTIMEKHSVFASQHACHNHGVNSALIIQFT